jgi:hypothetical protein
MERNSGWPLERNQGPPTARVTSQVSAMHERESRLRLHEAGLVTNVTKLSGRMPLRKGRLHRYPLTNERAQHKGVRRRWHTYGSP